MSLIQWLGLGILLFLALIMLSLFFYGWVIPPELEEEENEQ